MRTRNRIHTLLLPDGLRLVTYDDTDEGELWRGDELLGSRVHWAARRIELAARPRTDVQR